MLNADSKIRTGRKTFRIVCGSRLANVVYLAMMSTYLATVPTIQPSTIRMTVYGRGTFFSTVRVAAFGRNDTLVNNGR